MEHEIGNDIYKRHSWRTMFLTGIHGRLAPATMLSYPSWEMRVIQPILKEHWQQSEKLKDKLKGKLKAHVVDYVILSTLIIALIGYRLIHTIQMIFVQISAHIDQTIPPMQHSIQAINGTVHGLSFFKLFRQRIN